MLRHMRRATTHPLLHTRLKFQRRAILRMHYIVRMSFRRVAYGTSQFTRFPNLDIITKLAKENFTVYFTHMKALVFSLKLIKEQTING